MSLAATCQCVKGLVAGEGVEPSSAGYEPAVEPFYYPATAPGDQPRWPAVELQDFKPD